MLSSRRSRVTALVLALVLALAAVLVAVTRAPDPAGAVEVVAVENAWGPVTEEEAVLLTTLTLRNTYPFSVTVTDAAFTVVANGVPLANGSLQASAELPADAESEVTLSTRVDTPRFVSEWWPAHVRAGERTTFEVAGSATVAAGPVTVDVPFAESRTWRTHVLDDLDGALRSCPSSGLEPCIASSTHAWGTATREDSRLHSTLRVRNPAPVPVPVTRTAFELRLAGVPVSESRADALLLLPPGATTDVALTSVIDHDALAEWWPRHVSACERSEAAVRVGLAGGLVSVEAPLAPVETDFACR